MTAPAPSVRVVLGARSGWLDGSTDVIHAAIRLVGCPKQYDRKRRAITVPATATHDVICALESFGTTIEVVES